MTAKSILAQLEAMGNPKVRTLNIRNGAGENQFGVKLGDIRKVAASLKNQTTIATKLWETGNLEARLVAILVMKPASIAPEDLDRMVREARVPQLADWLNSYVVRSHPGKEALREAWLNDNDVWAARAGWSLTSERIGKSPDGLDLPTMLDRIEKEMLKVSPEVQWTMNYCLAGIGIHFPEYRKRAIAIGEALGVFRDYPVSKGCTSPFAPIWINEIVKRNA